MLCFYLCEYHNLIATTFIPHFCFFILFTIKPDHIEEFPSMYCSPIIVRVFKSRKIRLCRAARMKGGMRAFKIYRKKTISRSGRRWEDNIRIYLKEIGVNTRNWIDSARDRDYLAVFVTAALNLRVS